MEKVAGTREASNLFVKQRLHLGAGFADDHPLCDGVCVFMALQRARQAALAVTGQAAVGMYVWHYGQHGQSGEDEYLHNVSERLYVETTCTCVFYVNPNTWRLAFCRCERQIESSIQKDTGCDAKL